MKHDDMIKAFVLGVKPPAILTKEQIKEIDRRNILVVASMIVRSGLQQHKEQ